MDVELGILGVTVPVGRVASPTRSVRIETWLTLVPPTVTAGANVEACGNSRGGPGGAGNEYGVAFQVAVNKSDPVQRVDLEATPCLQGTKFCPRLHLFRPPTT